MSLSNNETSFVSSLFKYVSYTIIAFVGFQILLSVLLGFVRQMQKRFLSSDKIKIILDCPTRLDDVCGLYDVKTDVVQYIDFLKDKMSYNEIGAELPKGLLLVGPPGSGKTLLAKAIAGESGVHFLSISGSDFNELYVGSGSNRVKELFDKARKLQPCIIFIDEIDGVGSKRFTFNSHRENDVTLNKLLVEMDGFESNENILIIGATNNSKNLDPALTRSGRFDKKIVMDFPNYEERRDICELYFNKVKFNLQDNEKEIFINKLSKQTTGCTGADIKNIINQSAIIAVKNKNKSVTIHDVENAIDDVIIGSKVYSRKLSQKEKEIVAHHEAGHAFMSYILKNMTPPIKVSIVPRGEAALGFSQQEPDENKLYTEQYLVEIICVLYGGRVSEKVFFDDVTTGAYDDIERATEIAHKIVTKYGFNKKIGLNNIYLQKNEEKHNTYSDDLTKTVDEEINKLLNNCYKKTLSIISKNKDKVKKIAVELLEKETIAKDDIEFLMKQTG